MREAPRHQFETLFFDFRSSGIAFDEKLLVGWQHQKGITYLHLDM